MGARVWASLGVIGFIASAFAPIVLSSPSGTRDTANTDTIVFAPHPDDETLGAAGIIYREVQQGRTVKVVVLTNGDAYQDMAQQFADYTKYGGDAYGTLGEVSFSSRYPDGIVLSPGVYNVNGGGAEYHFTGLPSEDQVKVSVKHYESGWGLRDVTFYVWNFQTAAWDTLEEVQVDGEQIWERSVDATKYQLGGEFRFLAGADAWDESDIAWVKVDRALALDPSDPSSAPYYVEFGKARQDETRAALEAMGVPSSSVMFLGYPDGGLDALWGAFRNGPARYTSPFTDSDESPYVEVGYQDYHFQRYGTHAPYTGASVIEDVADILRQENPSTVFVTHYLDTHVDHARTNDFVAAALQTSGVSAVVYSYLIHYDAGTFQGTSCGMSWPVLAEDTFTAPDSTFPAPSLEIYPDADFQDFRDSRTGKVYGEFIDFKLHLLEEYRSQRFATSGTNPLCDVAYLNSFAKLDEIFWPSDGGTYFLFVTDTHVGQSWQCPNAISDLCPDLAQTSEQTRLRRLVSMINAMNPRPSFVLFGGDLVDSLTKVSPVSDASALLGLLTGRGANMMYFAAILDDPVSGLKVPYYLTLGNHDYRFFRQYVNGGTWSIPNFPFFLVTNEAETQRQVASYLTQVDPRYSPTLPIYSFDQGNLHVIQLASGMDNCDFVPYPPFCSNIGEFVGSWSLPEGTGFTSSQMDSLERDLDYLDGTLNGMDTSGRTKIIFMHHPVVNAAPGVGDGAVLNERQRFTRIAEKYGVSLVLSGHTHRNALLDETGSPYGSDTWTASRGPMYAQTGAAKDYEYRLVHVRGNRVTSTTGHIDTIRVMLASDSDLNAYDTSGRHVGLASPTTGLTDVDIPDSLFSPPLSADDIIPQEISVTAGDTFRFEVHGWETGHFTLTIGFLMGLTPTRVIYVGVPTTSSSTAYVVVSSPSSDLTMWLDQDGDGFYEEMRIPSVTEEIEEPGGRPPVANAGEDRVIDEGEETCFDASATVPNDAIITGYSWDFNEDGVPESTAARACTTYYDNTHVTVVLTVSYVIINIKVDDSGNVAVEMLFGSVTDTVDVTVLNVSPVIRDVNPYSDEHRVRGFIYVNMRLRIAGEKWHDVRATLWSESDGVAVASVRVYRTPGSPDDQSQTASGIYIDIEKVYILRAEYDPLDDPVNGQVQGSTPVWVFFEFADGTEMLHHNFNTQQSTFRDTDRWIHVEPWVIDTSPLFVNHTWTFEQKTTDPGTDDLCHSWDWGDGTGTVKDYPWDGSGVCGDDGGSTPWDLSEGSYPPTSTDTYFHTYTSEGNYRILFRVRDDDGGSDQDELIVRAIHLPHIAPTR